MAKEKIIINKNISLTDIDKLYIDLEKKIGGEFSVDLIIPVELNKDYLGLSSNIIQFTSTWIRSNKSGKLIIDIEWPSDKLLDNINKKEYLLPVIGLAWNNNGVYDNQGNNLRKHVRLSLNNVFKKMLKVEALKGDKLLLTNLDHLPEDVGILPCFENDGKYVSKERDLATSLEETIINDVLRNYSQNERNLYKEVKRDLNSIIYELMKNTFEWAKTDEKNIPYDPNIRGVVVKMNKKGRANLLEDYKSNNSIKEYFQSDRIKENSKGEVYFLEISVFDSGAGFIDKYKSLNNLSNPLNEIDILKRCLIKHNTSAKGLSKSDKGIGLDKILDILNGKGWIRIRTGSSCVYRNLITDPYISISNKDIDKMKLYDWKNNSDIKFSNYPKVSGSTITIIFPLSINR